MTANDSVSVVYEDDGNCYTFFENETWLVVITPECFDIVGVTHELGDALGLGHAHNRQDCDEYITVDDTIIEEFYNDVAEAYKKGVRKDYDATLEFIGSDRCKSSQTQCQHRGYPNPKKCDECVCPSGYGGKFCDEKPPGCGNVFIEKSGQITITIRKPDDDRDYFKCTHWIQ
ncbi:hypothetical protein ANCDUO_09329, partial [Ancylostoma duodenale]